MPTTSFWQWLEDHDGYGAAAAGVSVTNESAMRQVGVLACINLLSETIASLPLTVFRRTAAGGKEVATDHDAYLVLHSTWNEFQSSFTGRETMEAHLDARGNAYALIERDGAGYTVGLWIVPPNCIEPAIEGGRLWYRITNDGTSWLGIKPGVYKADDVLHIHGLGFDGLKGYNPIQLARDAIGLSVAAETFGGKFFGAGARAGGVLETDAPVTSETVKSLTKQWNEIHTGVYNAHKVALLTHGMKYKAIGVTPDEAQFLDTRKFQLTEIARLFGIPPAMIGASTGDSQTYANQEQRMLEFAMLAIRPRCVKWEHELNRKMFTPRERGRYFAKFNIDALLRADLKTRYDSYQLAINKWLTKNEIRDLEDRNPVDGGDEFQQPEKAPVLPEGAKA